jgi:hypothetical protein
MKKEVEDYEKKVKTVMVKNSTNINHHSLNTKKRGETPSDVDINKFLVYGECHIHNKHQLLGVVIGVHCCNAFILSQATTCIFNIRWCCHPFFVLSEW